LTTRRSVTFDESVVKHEEQYDAQQNGVCSGSADQMVGVGLVSVQPQPMPYTAADVAVTAVGPWLKTASPVELLGK
jgi:hypothetical protein